MAKATGHITAADVHDGDNSYFHIAWADDAVGTNFSTTTPATRTYIGTYTDSTLTASANHADYTWSLYVGAVGDDGTDGDDGAPGSRGSRQMVVTVSTVNSATGGSSLATSKSASNPWQSAGSISATTTQGLKVSNWVKNNSAGSDGTLIPNDAVTVYHVANQWSSTRSYDGSGNWITVEEVIDGNLLVQGSISANKLIIGGGAGALNPAAIGADSSGSAAAAQAAAIAASDSSGSAAAAQAAAIAASDSSGSAAAAQAAAIAASDSSGSAAAARVAAIASASTDASTKVAAVTNNIYTANTTTIAGGKITTGTVTADRLILNNNALQVEGNNLTIAGAALNRTHILSAGTTTVIPVPYLATSMVMTGCAAGGGRSSHTNTTNDRRYTGGAGGGAAATDYRAAVAANITHVRVIVGSGVSSANGQATSVATSTNNGGSYSTILTLGGGNKNGTATNSPSNGYAGGSTAPWAAGQTANGQTGLGQTSGYGGGQAGLGSGTTRTDWEYGNGGYGSAIPVGFGGGAGGGAGPRANGALAWSALRGGHGFMILTFGV